MYVHPQFFTYHGPAKKGWEFEFLCFFLYFHRKIIVHRDTDTFFFALSANN
jgi:hypothetical protein